ncbi:MAG: DNA-3-methyladenine glycosylase family protein [Phycisphaerales bacterium JB043]
MPIPAPPGVIRTREDLLAQIHALGELEPVFRRIHDATDTPPLRLVPLSLESLLSIITDQMLSRHAADAIWKRTRELLDPLTPQAVLATSEQSLRDVGQSRAKIRTFRAIAQAMLDRALDLDALDTQPDGRVIETLTQLPGVGDWTSHIVLLTCLGRADAFPAADVALQSATQSAFGLDARPSTKDLVHIAEAWRPHRATAARLLWAYYRLHSN